MDKRDKLLAVYKLVIRQPQNVFAVLALVFGLIFTFNFAPLNGTDEFVHFPRVYQISQGTLFPKHLSKNVFGGYLPANLNHMIDQYRNLSRFSTDPSYLKTKDQLNNYYSSINNPGIKLVPANFTSTVHYPPWAYLPSLVGLMLARALHLPLVWYVYLARITTLLFWLSLTYLAIKLLPRGKWFLVALALVPTAITQASTIGADGLVMSLSWLVIAMVLAVIAGKLKLDWWKLTILGLLAVYLSIIKDGYFLLGLVPLAIPSSFFVSKKASYLFKGSLVAAIATSAVLFTLRTVHALNGVVLTPTIGMNINSHDQIDYILHHWPTYFIHVLVQPLTKSFDTYYLGIVGIITNRLIYLSIPVIFLLFFGLYLGLKNTRPIEAMVSARKSVLSIFLGIFVSTYFLLATTQYIGNTSVGAAVVNSVYGRYFLPILPLLLVIPMSLRSKAKANNLKYVPAVCLISLIGLVDTIISLK